MISSHSGLGEKLMDCLKAGLGPFVVENYIAVYPGNYRKIMGDVLGEHRSASFPHADSDLIRNLDVYALLKLMKQRWDQVFKKIFSSDNEANQARTYVTELLNFRNAHAHQQISNEDYQRQLRRAADTAELLLATFNLADCAAIAHDIAAQLYVTSQPRSTSFIDHEGPTALDHAKSQGQMLVEVLLCDGTATAHRLTRDKAQIIVGRSEECDIVLKDQRVSRIHCQISWVNDGSLTVTDLHSNNGTFLNGRMLAPNTAYAWMPGTTTSVGDCRLILRHT